ncbi:MAG TPA: hypothetical protein VGR56_08125 [Nitrososphaerales archaeon]|nr:hypothetical protein [Nitrososphaerales archaeon]
MKVGTYEIPDMRLNPTLTDAVKTMYNKFGEGEVDYITLAPVLGHKTSNSGSFIMKIANLRAYRLIDGRGKVKVSDIGRKMAFPKQGTDEENQGYIEAVSNIPLWKELYEKYTKVNASLPADDFWIILRQITGVTPEEAKTSAETVKKAYLDDARLIRAPKQAEKMETNTSGQGAGGDRTSPPPISTEVISFEGGALRMSLPAENIKVAWKKAKKMVDAYFGTEKE